MIKESPWRRKKVERAPKVKLYAIAATMVKQDAAAPSGLVFRQETGAIVGFDKEEVTERFLAKVDTSDGFELAIVGAKEITKIAKFWLKDNDSSATGD